jgi:hypothetical protein
LIPTQTGHFALNIKRNKGEIIYENIEKNHQLFSCFIYSSLIK